MVDVIDCVSSALQNNTHREQDELRAWRQIALRKALAVHDPKSGFMVQPEEIVKTAKVFEQYLLGKAE